MRDADLINRSRGIRNQLAVANLQGSMFSSSEINELSRNGQNVDGFNLFAKYLRGVSGIYLSNWFDPKFSASSSSDISIDTMRALEEVYISDKDVNDYKSSSAKAIWDGLVYRGIEEIFIKRPSLSDPRTWSIGFRPVRSESIIFDPANNDDRISRNSQRCIKFSYYSQVELEQIYPQKKSEIRKAEFDKLSDNDYRTTNGIRDAVLDADQRSRNNRYQCVEYYHIENEYDKRRVHTKTYTPIPDFGVDHGTPEDRAALMAWGLTNGVSVAEDDIHIVEDVFPILYVDVWIPELGVLLDSGKDERQLDGHLPFYSWSYFEMLGTSIGLVDQLWGCVSDFNAREKSKTKWIEKTPQSKSWVDPKIVGNNQKKLQQLQQEWSDGSKPIVVDSTLPFGAADRLIGRVQGGDMPQAILHDESMKLSLMNDLSGLTAALQGMSERSGESGDLYGRKVIEGGIQQKYPMIALQQHEHDKVSDWIKLVPKVYGGPANYNRKFRKHGTRDFIMANEFMGYDDFGNPIVQNDFSAIERVEITIGKSSESDFVKQAMREDDLRTLKYMQPTETNGEVRAVVENNLALNMRFTSDEEKRNMEEAVARRSELEKLKSEAMIEQLGSQIVQTGVQEGQAIIADSMLEESAQVAQLTSENQKLNLAFQNTQLKQQLNQMMSPTPAGPMGPQQSPANMQPQTQAPATVTG
jgi:hypothetical protein